MSIVLLLVIESIFLTGSVRLGVEGVGEDAWARLGGG